MALGACSEADCTVAETGTCVRSNDPATCPNRLKNDADAQTDTSLDAPLEAPPKNPSFPSSLTLGPDEAGAIMRSRYTHLVGVLGMPKSGKTAALVSTYLLLGRGKLEGFDFLDSQSLRALDEISHGARVWKPGEPFEHMTVHTELSDERTPGFMHLRLRRAGGDAFDFLLPDLPGEWSSELIDSERSDRLQFLRAADAIWIMIDGEELKTKRLHSEHRTKMLMQRLGAFLGHRPPITLVITRRDHGAPDENTIDALKTEASRFGFVASVAPIASFKNGDAALAGAGIAELIASVIDVEPLEPDFWPDVQRSGGRAMLDFRREQGQ